MSPQNFLTTLGLSNKRQQGLESEVRRLSSVGDFAADVIDNLSKSDLVKAIGEAAPWMEPIGTAAAEAVPFVKVLTKTVEKLKPKASAEQLGLLACTMALQHSLQRAICEVGPPAIPIPLTDSLDDAKDKLATLRTADPTLLRHFSLHNPAANPFARQALEALRIPLWLAGYNDAELRRLEANIHQGFSEDLYSVLSAPETREKFAPFLQRAQLGSEADRAHALINAHAEKQRAAFSESRTIGVLQCPLSQLYVATDCGRLTWETIRGDGKRKPRVDAFAEANGGRQDLLATVLGYLRDADFKDAVVIQGSAGAGKSTFTLRLAVELLREGLVPIRIRINQLRTDLPLLKAIHEVIVNTSGLFTPEGFARPSDVLLGGAIFDDVTVFGTASISRYVFILDGWDEISTAAKSFQKEIWQFLQSIRNELVNRANPPVRVVLTGRPTPEVTDESAFFDDATPILTIRPYSPWQLQQYLHNLRDLTAREGQPGVAAVKSVADRLISRYSGTDSSRLEVLSQPLLALLTFQVASECENEDQLDELLARPTNLYRRLVDLTCSRAGKAELDPDAETRRQRARRQELRPVLRRTAAAITTLGDECISYPELVPRARLSADDKKRLESGDNPDKPWTQLILGFFFKAGGVQHGMQFLHKSFREYLYAEEIVECLKLYGLLQRHEVAVRTEDGFWQDFPRDNPQDQRYAFSRALSQLISARPLDDEVREHLKALLHWEVQRSSAAAARPDPLATEPVTPAAWDRARELLTEMWGWWLSRTPLRMQLEQDPVTGRTEMRPPYVDELINLAAQRDRSPENKVPPPVSGLAVDGILGSSLLFITVALYSAIHQQQGWQGDWPEINERIEGQRLHTTEILSSAGPVLVFAPCAPNSPSDFQVALSRFMTTGHSMYPASRISLCGLDLRGAKLILIALVQTDFTRSNLFGADLAGSILESANFREVDLREANFFGAYLKLADLSGAQLEGAELDEAFGLGEEQIALAIGDEETLLPDRFTRPAHWIKPDENSADEPEELDGGQPGDADLRQDGEAGMGQREQPAQDQPTLQ
jgi:hypothetical protein